MIFIFVIELKGGNNMRMAEDFIRDLYAKIENSISKSFVLFYHIICKPKDICSIDMKSQNLVFFSSQTDLDGFDNYMTLYREPLISLKVYDQIKSYKTYTTNVNNEINVFNIHKSDILHLDYEYSGSPLTDRLHLTLSVY
jgi:hypothetical protein